MTLLAGGPGRPAAAFESARLLPRQGGTGFQPDSSPFTGIPSPASHWPSAIGNNYWHPRLGLSLHNSSFIIHPFPLVAPSPQPPAARRINHFLAFAYQNKIT